MKNQAKDLLLIFGYITIFGFTAFGTTSLVNQFEIVQVLCSVFGVVVGVIMIGLAEIIALLQSIKDKLHKDESEWKDD